MLKVLCEIDAVSGRESALRERILAEIMPFCDEATTDAIGNLIAVKSGKNNGPSVLLTVPMDECGLLISKIEEDGFLRFETIGDFSVSTLPAQSVKIGNRCGVIGQKAVHLTAKEEREKEPELTSLYIDIGAASCEDAAKLVMVGDTAVLDVGFSTIGNAFAKGRGLGERMACAIAISLLKQSFDVNLTVVFAAQHQIGSRGLRAALFEKHFDIGIMIDGVAASADKKGLFCGKGVVLHQNASPMLLQETEEIAEEKKLCLQKNEEGHPALCAYVKNLKSQVSLQIPVRYRESAVQMASLKDMENMEKLVHALLCRIERGEGR